MPGYYAATEEYGALHGSPGATDRYWRAPDARIVHFLGFDCSFSHAIAYPTLASNFPDFTRNLHLYTNAFLKLNGGDFSTSRGHAIWIRDMLKETSSDSLRTYIAGVAPEESTENFAVADFRGWKSQHYEEATARLLEAATAARARQSQAGAAAADVELASAMRRSWHGAMDLERYSMKALAVLLHEFRSQVLERLRVGAEVSAGLVAAYAVLGEPLHPGLSAQLYERLAIDRETLRGWLRQHDAQLPGVPARAEEAHVLQADRRASHGDTMAVRG
jgi:methionyl-tRNA synthetase